MIAALLRIPKAERRAAALSLVTGVVLLAIKFFAYWLTGSAAVFSDAMESIVNVMASLVALYALAVAHRPPDKEHPYGHGKIEFVSAGFEGGMILLAAVFIAVSTLDTLLFRGLAHQELEAGLLLVTLATLINGGVGFYLIAIGRRQSSPTLVADGRHLLADAVTSVAVLAALGLVKLTNMPLADPIVALCIACYIGYTGLRLLRESAAGLMDEQDLADEDALESILRRHLPGGDERPTICSYHKLRHRHSGRYHWVDFHLVVPSAMSVAQGHAIASHIEYEMERTLGEGNASAHIEPCVTGTCSRCDRVAPGVAAGVTPRDAAAAPATINPSR